MHFTFDTIKKALNTPQSNHLSPGVRFGGNDKMKTSDVGRRVRIFDRPVGEGSGLLGTVLEVIDDYSFRFLSEKNGRETEFIGFKGKIQFLDDEEVLQ